MRLTDPAVTALTAAAYKTGTDVFLQNAPFCGAPELETAVRDAGGRWAVLLPGALPVPAPAPFLYLPRTGPLPDAPAHAIPVADVRILNREDFAPWLRRNGVAGFLLPFAECAFVAEHGYRASYRLLGELRAEGMRMSVTALLSDERKNAPRLRELLLSPDAALLTHDETRTYPAVRFSDDRERERFLLNECRRTALGRTAILFPSRERAAAFRQAARRRGIPCGLIHGGRTEEENRAEADAFLRGELPALAATKCLLPAAPFFRADRVLYAGLPFGRAHAARCAALSREGTALVCTTDRDRDRAEILSAGFARDFGADEERFLACRREMQDALLPDLNF